MKFLQHLFTSIWLGTVALGASPMPLAGSDIVNRADARFQDARSGLHSTATSNGVTINVSPFEAAALLPGTHLRTVVGGRVGYVQRLTNTGNVRTEFLLQVRDTPNDGFDLDGFTLTRDLNGNGLVDPGEPPLAAGQSTSLAAGESADLVIQADVAGTPAEGTRTELDILASSRSSAARASARHSAEIASGPVFQVSKRASTQVAEPGDTVAYQLTAFNAGTRATGFPVTVDGITRRLLLLRDALAANTALRSITATGGGQALYHLRGAKPHDYRSDPGSDLTLVDAVALAWTELDTQVTVAATLELDLSDNASGTIRNTATLLYADPQESGPARQSDSNTTRVRVRGGAARLNFTNSASSDQPKAAMRRGKPAYLRLATGACNSNPNQRDTVELEVTASLSLDAERVRAVETSVNSGIFRVTLATADAARASVVRGDGTLQVRRDDELQASGRGCATQVNEAAIGVDPTGVVFDSKLNLPVAGAQVTLIDVTGAGNNGRPGEPAEVFDVDSITPLPSSVRTGADGRYTFPIVRPSLYRLVVVPPSNYTWTSVLPPDLLPAGRTILATGSYGGDFEVSFATGALTIDIPIDIKPPGGMALQKAASRSSAEIGDIVAYELRLRNISGAGLGDVVIHDALPAGFAYVEDSVRLNGQATGKPRYTSPRQLAFAAFDLPNSAEATMTYRLRITPTAQAGDNVNRAQASSLLPIRRLSNVAQATVRISEGVFSRRGFVLGKVFLDCNRNRLQDDGEAGIPGVRIYLEDGRFAVTDGGGKYNFAGIAPRTHVAKLDRTTLPPGAVLDVLDNRNAGDAGSRFVDLRPGALQRADFASPTCTPSVREDIAARRQHLQQHDATTDPLKPLALESSATRNRRSLPASLVVELPSARGTTPQPPSGPTGAARDAGAEAIALESLLPTLDARAAVLDLADGAVLTTTQHNLRVKGDMNLQLRLAVNGQAIGADRIGKSLVDKARGVQLTEYISVRFATGRNLITLTGSDSFGIERVRRSYSLRVAGEAAQLEIGKPSQALPADGQSKIAVAVALRDADSLPVGTPSALTLHTDAGTWLVPDEDATLPGTQTTISGGEQIYYLRAPSQPTDALVRAEHADLQARQLLSFVTAPRPLIVAGIIEAAIGRGAAGPAGSDVFDGELSGLLDAGDAGRGTRTGTRAAVFAKGEIAPGRELTLGYDSAKDPDDTLFRDPQSEPQYPVYGDASRHGYDAQSGGKLFARINEGKSYLQWGDFVTPRARGAQRLGAYGRSLNGLSGRYMKNGLRVDGFLTRADSRQVVRELAADGTSGPFQLDTGSLVPGSERVELVTRDRTRTQRILEVVSLSRPLDYETDPLYGTLLLRAPVASIDADGNPVSIRLNYEVERDGPRFWVGGLKATYRLTPTWTVGGSMVVDRDPLAGMRLSSAHMVWEPSDKTQVRAEVAHVSNDRDDATHGNAARIELRHAGDSYTLRAFAERADAGFDNPSADLAAGRTEVGARLAWQAGTDTKVIADARHSANHLRGTEQQHASVGIKRSLNGNRTLELGLRADRASQVAAAGNATSGSHSDVSARARLSSPLPGGLPGSAFVEAEHSLRNSGRRMLAVGGDYRMGDALRIYGRHELVSSPNRFDLLDNTENRHATVLGIDTRAFGDGRSYSEYRIREAIDGRRAEAAVGLRRSWDTGWGLRLDGAFERIKAVGGARDGAASGDHTSIALGAGYRSSPVWKGSARIERKIGAAGSGNWLLTAGATRKLDEDWVALGKMVWSRSDASASRASRLRQRVRLGVAYRDARTNRANALARYELRRQKDGAASVRSHVVSAHGDYRLSDRMTVSGHGAAKWVSDRSGGQMARTRTMLLGARLTWDITPRWDISLSASRLFDGGGGHRSGVGLELGYRVTRNLWVAVGMTRAGQRDSDLGGPSWTGNGAYIRLRFKFDEEMFRFGEDAP